MNDLFFLFFSLDLLQQQGLSFSTASFKGKTRQGFNLFLVVAEVIMGKKGWFYAMKKAISPSISKNKKERSRKSKSNPKKLLQGNEMSFDACSSPTEATLANPFHDDHLINETEFILPENEQIKHVDSIIYATNVAKDETSDVATEVNDSIIYAPTIVEDTTSNDVLEVNFITSNSCFLGKTREEMAAIKIQTAFRGHMARRAFLSLRTMTRLNSWIQGQAVKEQTASTLKRIQTMGRVQSQVRTRTTRMAEVNKTLQRQQTQKREKVLYKDFDLSPKSKEQVEARRKSNKEAAERREKALAYAFSRQQTWRNSQKSANVDANAINWEWSWSYQSNALRPLKISNKKSKLMTCKSQISKPLVGLAKKQKLVINSPSSKRFVSVR
ncbi:hypothetical protein QVD17_07372 [Tagetes erecta]|uniref:Uncharacterized protein n=1 Tax=Tagetes erecta TaxID=13708 RepID=A0AAD8LHK1_TARER|nr:hypothetical protein QVD17_07372 [Tagetes erecta]